MEDSCRAKVAGNPGGLSYQLQPLDISIKKPFKAFFCDKWTIWVGATDHSVRPAQYIDSHFTCVQRGEQFVGVSGMRQL